LYVDDSDSEILNITREISERLDLDFGPTKVDWQDIVADGRYLKRVDYDEPIIGRTHIILANAMKGKLTPEEWKPLIMSSLLYSEKLVWERNKKVGLSILPIFVPVIAGFFAPIYLLPYSLGKLVLGAYLPFFVLGLIYMVYRGNLVYRSYRTRADQETAKILGKDLILNTLLKIDAMHLPNLEAEKMRRRLSRTMWRPNISDRIALLRDMNS